MRRYNAYSAYLKKKFGTPVRKVPLNGGFSCPNRDGTTSSRDRGRGCFFCDNRAFSPAAVTLHTPLEQLQMSISRLSGRYQAFIAYLQPFSNTYGNVELLRSVYEPLIRVKGVVGLSVGTRPDCLPEAVCDYLGDLATRTFLSVEIGLQSSHDTTLASVNRGHSFDDFVRSVQRLSSRGIETVAHVMLGLPGETDAMMYETASRLAELPVTGVKIHQLMIIKGTPMDQMFAEGKAEVLAIEEYAPLVSGFLERLRPDLHVHRIMADSRKEHGLIAPEWSADKASSTRFLHAYFESHGVVQGRKVKEKIV